MLLIRCPWCGERAQSEFAYEGDATVSRPDPDAVSDAEWAGYIYLRDNPMGPHDETWQHIAGCRRYFTVRRDTLTHEILSTSPPKGGTGGDEK